MAVYREAGQLVSDSSDIVYEVDGRFWKVLQTLPADEPVPYALVLLGLLTDQLTPRDADTQDRAQQAVESIERVPAASVPPQTQKAIQWLLAQIRNSLSTERKQKVGEFLAEAEIATRTAHARSSTGDTASDTSEPTSESTDKEPQQVSTSSLDGEQFTTTDASSHEPAPESKNSRKDESSRKTTSESQTERADKTVECEHCGAAFATTAALISHSIQCTERPADAKYVCEHCGNKYISEEALADHLEDCSADSGSGSATHTCSNCEADFESVQELLSHRRTCGTQAQEDEPQPGEVVAEEATGRIVNYRPGDGYGFIRTFALDGSGPDDIFFHISDFPDTTPQEGQHLQFDVENTNEGYQGINIEVRPLDDPEPWDETFSSSRPRWGFNT